MNLSCSFKVKGFTALTFLSFLSSLSLGTTIALEKSFKILLLSQAYLIDGAINLCKFLIAATLLPLAIKSL